MRILVILAKLHNLHTKSVDFIQAYPQAAIKSSIFLCPPDSVILNDKNGTLVLKLLNNLYGLKKAGRTWFEHLINELFSMIFVGTSNDPCIFTKGINIIILYVDDCIIMSRTKEESDRLFAELERRKYKLTEEGTMEEYLGILVTHNDDGSYLMSQPFLIERIIYSIPAMVDARSAESPHA